MATNPKAKQRIYSRTFRENNLVKVNQRNKSAFHFNKRVWKNWLEKNCFVKCEICGYDRSFRALEFHHIDPKTKAFGIAHWFPRHVYSAKNEAILEAEIAKCIRVCSNCHREIHDDFINILTEKK